MNRFMSLTKKVFSTTNVVRYILGLMGLSLLAFEQFIAEIMPLLFAPMVCGILGFLVYVSQPNNPRLTTIAQPTPITTQNE